MRLQGKTALVTGSTSGIGQAIAEAFAREGANIVVSGRDEQRGKAVVETIRATGGSAAFVFADLSSKAEVDRLAGEAIKVFGQIDILVNNAGMATFGPTAQVGEPTFDALLNTNVKAPYYFTAALASHMAERGAGKIINITSMAAHIGMPGLALFGATKAALAQLTKSWAAEFAHSGVNVNAIAPGPTLTPANETVGAAFMDQMTSTLPAGRAASPSEIADAAVYLASPESNFVHGITLPVDGGRTAV